MATACTTWFARQLLESVDDRLGHAALTRERDSSRVQDGQDGNKLELLKRYKFYLAFENSNVEDYVTEKVYQGLRVGSVPSRLWLSSHRSNRDR